MDATWLVPLVTTSSSPHIYLVPDNSGHWMPSELA